MTHRQLFVRAMLFSFAGILVFCFCSPSGDSTLATFEGGDIQTDEYVEYFLSSTKYKKDVMPDEANLRHIVTLKAMEKIAIIEAIEQGIEKDSVYIESIENNMRKTLFFKYMRQEIINQVINDSLIQTFYKNFSPQYHMAYILRPVVNSSTPAFEKSQKDTIEHVYRLLSDGGNFEELAGQFSQDITTNNKGGSLGFVIRESMGDASLRAAMDTLKDLTWSTPIRGYNGYYILYKGERRDVAVPPIEEAQPIIWQTLYRTRRHDIERKLENRFQHLTTTFNFSRDEKAIDLILKKAGAGATTSIITELDFDLLSEDDMGTALATYDGGVLKLYELFEEKNRKPGNKLEFEERMKTISHRHLLSKHASELGYENADDIVEKFKDVRESLLRSFLHRRNVIDKAKKRLAVIEKQESLADVKKESDEFRLVTLQRSIKEEFEKELLEKYKFEFKPNNFKAAMKVAEEKKIEQNEQSQKSEK